MAKKIKILEKERFYSLREIKRDYKMDYRTFNKNYKMYYNQKIRPWKMPFQQPRKSYELKEKYKELNEIYYKLHRLQNLDKDEIRYIYLKFNLEKWYRLL